MTVKLQRKRIIDTLDRRGWTQGNYGDDGDGPVCLHGAIRVCQPKDAALIEQVWSRRGYGTGWNDAESTTEDMVLQYVVNADPITDKELAAIYGPQWKQIVALVRRVSQLTKSERSSLTATWEAAGAAAWDAAREAAEAAARAAARAAAWDAARWTAPWAAARGAAVALSVRDLIGPKFTQAHYDTLTRPWRTVIGPIHPDDKNPPRSKSQAKRLAVQRATP